MAAYGNPVAAIPGLLDAFPHEVESGIAYDDIGFGEPVFGDVGVENIVYSYASYDDLTAPVFLGVAVFVQAGSKTMGAGTAKYEAGDSVSILKKGRIWVTAASTVSDKDAAYVVTSTGVFSDVNTNEDVNGYFRSTYSGGLALLEVNGMIPTTAST